MLSRRRSAIGPAGRALRGDRRGICHQRQQIRSRWSRNVDPVDRIEDSRYERIEVERGKLTVVHRLGHAPVILAARTDNQFVDEWIAKTLNLRKRTNIMQSAKVWANGDLSPGGCRPCANGSLRIGGGVDGSVARQQPDRNLDDNGVDVEPGHGIRRQVEIVVLVLCTRENSAAGGRAKVEAIECSAKINEERIGDRAGKNSDVRCAAIALQRIDSLRSQGVVVRHCARPHIAWELR